MLVVKRILRQSVMDTAYLVVGFPLGLIAFILTMTLFWLGVGTLVIVAGFPILMTAIFAARLFADIERLRLPSVLHAPARRPRYRSAPAGSGFWRRLFTPLADGQSWLDLTHAFFHWILATIGFCFAVAWWAGGLGGVTSVLWDWSIPRGPGDHDLNTLIGLGSGAGWRIGLSTFIGVVFLVTLPMVLRLWALTNAQFSRVLLNGLAEIQNRVTELSEQRDSAMSAEASALRRLERDIHDGPQQRLVRLAMDLGRARHQLDHNPTEVRATLDEALSQARETLDELRALSRGIAPPILTDRGLAAALNALAARGLIPIGLTVDPQLGRLPALTENTAYFVVAEALTNVAKHSRAGFCAVRVARAADRLLISVADDGVGGASVAKGHGLAGLTDRIRAAGGTLTVVSPAGGPTEIRAELPCG
jgi:signal transduction histidine kinase